MTPERESEIDRLYHAALEVAGSERLILLAQADLEVRREVELLLEQDRSREEALDPPTWKPALRLIDEASERLLSAGAQVGPVQDRGCVGRGRDG